MKRIGMILILLYCSVTLASFFVPDSSVTTAQLRNDAVTTGKIADGAVTQQKRAALTSSTAAIGSYTNSTNSYTDINSVTITTTGRPVFVGLIASQTASTEGVIQVSANTTVSDIVGRFRYLVDGTDSGGALFASHLTANFLNTDYIQTPCSSLSTILTGVSPGSHTFKIQGRVLNAGSNILSVLDCRLIAYEL